MKAVADTLAVARSNLIERVSRRAKSRRPYRKAGDDELLRLVDERPTYGYRRIRRLINRQRKANGKPPVNGIPSNSCSTTARLTSPRTRSTPQPPWASSFVSRQSARQNPTASRRHSSKPSNAIMLGCRSCRSAAGLVRGLQ